MIPDPVSSRGVCEESGGRSTASRGHQSLGHGTGQPEGLFERGAHRTRRHLYLMVHPTGGGRWEVGGLGLQRTTDAPAPPL